MTNIWDVILWTWFALTALSVGFVTWDLFARTPEMKVMKWGWILVTLYIGPIALAVYWLSCREPSPGSHEKFVAPQWKQSIGSLIHCLAGDATGIIAAAVVTSWLRLPMGIDAVVEYMAGFSFGLLIFQALFMKDMMGVSYRQAVKSTFLPEWLSMNAVMSGMIPVMIALMTWNMDAMEPTNPRFWGIMSLATVVGAIMAYPVNWWMVERKIKHGMGTERALGKGGSQISPPAIFDQGANMKDMTGMSGQNESQRTPEAKPGGHDMSAMGKMGGMEENTKAQPRLSTTNLVVVSLLTMGMLAGGLALAARYGDLSMRAGQGSMKSMNMPRDSSRSFQFNREHGATGSSAAQNDMNGMTMPQR